MKTLYALIGHPLGHSFSQSFFRAKFEDEGVDADYVNFDIAHVEDVLDIVRRNPALRGFNVTIPHKQSVMPLLSSIDPAAAAIGAVNTVCVSTMRGYNTDYVGFAESIKPLLAPHMTRALVLGTGGSSRAVHYALRQMGIATQAVSRERKEGCIAYADITPATLASHHIVVNCTPLGMHPHTDVCPPLPYEAIGREHLLFDLVYNPPLTLFLARGKERGATVKNGQEMLERQALLSYEIWNNAQLASPSSERKLCF